jgi:serine/threonine protein kinase
MKLCPQCETGYADSHITCPTHGVMLGEIRELRPGMLIRNTYRVVRKLGQGGMGAVYLCEHTLMEERQALKFLSPELSRDQAFASRFRREVRTLRQVRHKNVVDAGNLEPAEDGTLFFSMEFVDGPDLRDFLNGTPKPLDVALAMAIARGIAEGLGAAHAQGLVHRDIKPENILMAWNGDGWTPKIADFGIVAIKEDSRAYTKTGGTLLTMAYAAPEQWRGVRAADLDGRTDLYALGGVLYEMLTGRTVFEAESYEGWAEQHKNVPPMPPSNLRPELADWNGLDVLVLRLLAKDREQRPRDVAEVLGLLSAVAYLPPATRRATEPEPSRATVWEKPGSSAQNAGKESRTRLPVWVWAASVAVLLAVTFIPVRFLGPQTARQEAASAETRPEQPKAEINSGPQPVTLKPAETPTPQKPKVDNGQMVWTDPSTGLMWAGKDNGSEVDSLMASIYCQNLRLDGHSGWRLPTIDELRGIYDAGTHGHVKGKLQLSNWWEWSSDPENSSGDAWMFDFRNGKREQLAYIDARRALCVLGSGTEAVEPRPRPSTISTQGESGAVWTDPATGLMWAKKDNGSDVDWQEATDYCRNLQLAGHSGWRLATVDELQGIYDASISFPGRCCVDHRPVNWHVKGNLQLSGFDWSSTSGNASGEALIFGLLNGKRDSPRLGFTGSLRALCVRRP